MGYGYFIIDTDMVFEVVVFMIVLMVVLGGGCWIAYFCIRGNDKAKPLCRARVKILEKRMGAINTHEWYVVQFENGERRQMSNYHAGRLILTVGDVGIMEYRGNTVESFRRETRRSSTRR